MAFGIIAQNAENAVTPSANSSGFNPSVAMTSASTAMGMDVPGFAQQLVGDPASFFSNDMLLSNQTPQIDPNAAGTNINPFDPKYSMDPSALSQNAALGATSTAALQAPTQAATYDAATALPGVSRPENQMTAAQGDVRDEAIIRAPQIDMQGVGTGVNIDGTTNQAGVALNQFASQNISNVIDTSTLSGKLLAETLGEFNYLDSKATLKGQMDILSQEFIDPVTGETKIPTWAAGAARSVSRIAAFKGITGSAATAVMAQAIMEASLPMAQADAQFFQTLTIKNLDNKQQQVINTANILSKMELANLDARMQSAVENSKNFMQMDMANLSNRQQAQVINAQARIQAVLEDAKAINTARLFAAESQNEMDKFYSNLNASISTFNAAQRNAMTQFNTGEVNAMRQFNSQLENQREQFYKEMQYNIDVANSKWRQSVTTTNTQLQFEAAATDVRNLVGVSVEQLNQLWDRSDALLDYAWRSSETAAERANQITIAKLQAESNQQISGQQADAQRSAARSSATGAIVGGVAGAAITVGAAMLF